MPKFSDQDVVDTVELNEVAMRRKYASKADQQCPCQDFTRLRHCICDEEEDID